MPQSFALRWNTAEAEANRLESMSSTISDDCVVTWRAQARSRPGHLVELKFLKMLEELGFHNSWPDQDAVMQQHTTRLTLYPYGIPKVSGKALNENGFSSPQHVKWSSLSSAFELGLI